MSSFPIRKLAQEDFPSLLFEIPEPPKQLYIRGNLPDPETKSLAVVGSRNYSDYGKQVVNYLIGGLRGYPISIISGLALGIDGLAHRAALDAGLYTLAVPGSGIDDSVLYPKSHKNLAQQILESGGGLLSEYEPTFTATQWSFPQRNRIMVGLADAVLVIEAGEKSGTLITARLACDYNRDLLVVPGNIFSENTKGPHQFLKLGALPTTSPQDILDALNLDSNEQKNTIQKDVESLPQLYQTVLHILAEPTDRDTLIRKLGVPTHEASTLLMQMELEGHIDEQNGIFSRLA